ncbi:hypothetical protein IMX26_14440 [Clostridium sp. 'deep sea']|uniref:hypothetical protein n=1 Tax=Clostridium sp. 'deep sea' TaxID=2779445 RepID=UPI001896968A|nr:hypothetical protein [Clostridium sp. 'deep sea']QOR34656.1 hypothetical protein IMX26_14440 [Clostridium sp. 'deep sea']
MKRLSSILAVVMILLVIFSGCTKNANLSEQDPTDNNNPAPVTTPPSVPDPVEPEPIVTTLSVLMSREDITSLLGENYTIKTEEDGFAYNYATTIAYDGITFVYGHDEEEVPEKPHLSEIRITSNNYKFNYEFKVGDTAVSAIELCEANKLEKLFNHHNEQHRFDVFKYQEKSNGDLVETSLVITWEYDSEEGHYESKDTLPNDVKIKTIRLFEPID